MKTALALLLSCCLSAMASETIDLSGRWHFQLGPADGNVAVTDCPATPFPDSMDLPGTVPQAEKSVLPAAPPALPELPPENLNPKKGILYGRNTNYAVADAVLMHLQSTFPYVGPAWYCRHVTIPGDWTNQDVQLVLERVIWETRVWVNGHFIGARNSLTTPHRYEIGAALKPGDNEIIIRVDNRRQLEIGSPHAYTDESQTIWNGLIGRIDLEARAKIRIAGLELRPNLARQGVDVTLHTHNDGDSTIAAELSLQARPDNFHGAASPPVKLSVSVSPGDNTQTVFYPLGSQFELWSEFNPKLYRLQATLTGKTLSGKNVHSQMTSTWGMREFKTAGRQFTINGQPVFLRGTVNCCEFPETGYPDMTGRQWEKIFSTAKAYGLNHMRFHTWCPPEVAFDLADRYGIYLEVELPDWCFKIGRDASVTTFFQQEGERMIHEYGNHPSWVMLTMGNELKGDYTVLDGLVSHFRKIDPQLLYDSTTYPSSSRGKIAGPADDYYISQDTPTGRARGQDIFDNNVPGTATNFEVAVASETKPFISHEVGQYCVYPHLAEIKKYRGVLRASNFEAIRQDLKNKGRLSEAPVYTHDSGMLAALLYKEEIERALRTPHQAGFQLLGLNDFPGQGTSTVGLLDAFWDSKGLIAPRAFKKFCAPVVPLVLMPKWVYQNSETFDAGIEIANFGPTPLTNAVILWKLCDGHKKIASGALAAPLIPLGHGSERGRIQQSLARVTHAAKLKLTVAIDGTSIANDWNVWVYPAEETPADTNDIVICHAANESFYQALDQGKRVLLLPAEAEVQAPLAATFVPVFWNPVMFPNQPGTMGGMITAKHPAFSDFPTDNWSDWQWWELLHRSFAINLDTVSTSLTMPFRFVDKFNRNALPAAIFETKIGSARLVVCTLDITHDLDTRLAARQLRRSLLNYMASDAFQPRGQLDRAQLKSLFNPSSPKSAH